MPLNIDIVQILLHMLNFVILAGGLTIFLFKPVCRFLNERSEYFERLERENAERAALSEQLKAEYEQKLADSEKEIKELKSTAEKEAAQSAKAFVESAKEQAAAIIAEAEADAEKRKSQIMESTQAEIEEVVLEATQKLLCDSVSEEHSRALFDEFIRNAEQFAPEKRISK